MNRKCHLLLVLVFFFTNLHAQDIHKLNASHFKGVPDQNSDYQGYFSSRFGYQPIRFAPVIGGQMIEFNVILQLEQSKSWLKHPYSETDPRSTALLQYLNGLWKIKQQFRTEFERKLNHTLFRKDYKPQVDTLYQQLSLKYNRIEQLYKTRYEVKGRRVLSIDQLKP